MLTFDTSGYRAHVGITGATDLTGARDEWQAWLDGDVYGVVVEHQTKRSPLCPLWICGAVRMGVEVDACWGCYGRRQAVVQAMQLLRAAARS